MVRLIPLLLLLLASCTAVRYVPVETVRTEIEHRDRLRIDTIAERDTVIIERRGDTVTITRIRDRWRTRLRVDTFERIRTDTIAVPVEVERPRTAADRTRDALAMMGAFLLGAIIALIVRAIKK